MFGGMSGRAKCPFTNVFYPHPLKFVVKSIMQAKSRESEVQIFILPFRILYVGFIPHTHFNSTLFILPTKIDPPSRSY